MNLACVEQIAKAVLYEGYMLYPYRPSSVKNQQRWNFGVLCPPSYSDAQDGSEASTMQTECLVDCSARTLLEIRVRFLQLIARSVGQLASPVDQFVPGEMLEFLPAEKLEVNGRVYQAWQEAVEREVIVPVCEVEALVNNPLVHAFTFPAEEQLEPLRELDGQIVGILVRERSALSGEVEVTANRHEKGLFKLSVRIRNTTPFTVTSGPSRDDALLSSLASAHTVL